MNDNYNLAENLFKQGLELISKNKFLDAKKILYKAHKILPERASIINNLIVINNKIKNFKESLDLAYKLKTIEPKNFESKIILSDSLIKNNFLIKARLMLKKIIKNEFKILSKENKIKIYRTLSSLYGKLCIPKKTVFYQLKAFLLSKNFDDLSSVIFNSQYVEEINKSKLYLLSNYNLKDTYSTFKKNTKISIGFISGDFHHHPVGFFLYSFLKEIKKKFSIILYYNSFEKDYLTEQLIFECCDGFNFINNLNDDELIEKIKKDRVDVLIDLSGHTGGNRLKVFFNRICKIQMTWMGFLASTGIKNIDYIVTDPHVYSNTEFFSEKAFMMPKIWCTLSKPIHKGLLIENITPAEKNGFFTFGSFNNLRKINSNVIKLWSSVLRHNKKSKLYLKNPDLDNKLVKTLLLNEFKKNNITSEQIIVEKSSDRETLLNSYNKIDIVLDTFPYSGGTTNFEASYMGVPILTKIGNSFLSNCGVSINKNLKMDGFIANNDENYIKIALELSTNLKHLKEIRKNHHQDVIISSLFDYKDFAYHFQKKISEELEK